MCQEKKISISFATVKVVFTYGTVAYISCPVPFASLNLSFSKKTRTLFYLLMSGGTEAAG